MRGSRRKFALTWFAGPLLAAGVGAAIAFFRAPENGSPWSDAAARSEAGQKALKAVPALSVANAIWALGSIEAVKRMTQAELARLPESEGKLRSRVFLRFGLIDSNPDGQAAVFFQACAADPSICQDTKAAAAAEARARLVAPGNQLPLYFLDGHP
jgi:hypothetical protein